MMQNVQKASALLDTSHDLQEFFCEIHGSYKSKALQTKMGTLRPSCPKCIESGQERLRQEKNFEKQKSETEKHGKKIAYLKKLNIGQKFWEEDFDTFNPYTQELQNNFQVCKSFVENPKGKMLVMMGKNGNGKNHLAAAMLKSLGGCMFSVMEIELLLRRSYCKEISEWKIYRRLCNAPLLVINEIGRHKLGNWDLNFLSYVINKRYENFLPIVLITNCHWKSECVSGGCLECFENYLNNDVLSRLSECGRVLRFTGFDYRVEKRSQKVQESPP